jgi:hypothetical protein
VRADEASVRARADATKTWSELKTRGAAGPPAPGHGRTNDGLEP